MLEAARTVASRADVTGGSTNNQLRYTPAIKVGGTAVSGSSFVDNDGYRQYLFQEFEARCTDLGAAAVAHIAYQNDVPFLFVLTMGTQAGFPENEPSSFPEQAAANAQYVVTALLRQPEQSEPTGPPAGSVFMRPRRTIALLFYLLIPLVGITFLIY